MGAAALASSDSSSARRVAKGSWRRSRSPRHRRSKNTTDAGVWPASIFTLDAAGWMRSCSASNSSLPFRAMTNSPSRTHRSGSWACNGSSMSGKYRLSDFSSRLWMKISSPSRKMRTRNPSHLGSKIQSPVLGTSSTRLASMGRMVGLTGRFTGGVQRHSTEEGCPRRINAPAGKPRCRRTLPRSSVGGPHFHEGRVWPRWHS